MTMKYQILKNAFPGSFHNNKKFFMKNIIKYKYHQHNIQRISIII